MVLEYIEDGNLFDFFEKHGVMTEMAARFFFNQMLDALQYFQDQGLSHRDIKAENILITKDLQLKIADFGFASK